jgi:hypothetical protein
MPQTASDAQRRAIRRAVAEHRRRQESELTECIAVLEAEAATIRAGDVNLLEGQAAVRRQCIRNLVQVQRAVDALERQYAGAYGSLDASMRAARETARGLASRVASLLQANRDAMRERADAVQRELAGLRLPRSRRSSFAAAPPSLLDIES